MGGGTNSRSGRTSLAQDLPTVSLAYSSAKYWAAPSGQRQRKNAMDATCQIRPRYAPRIFLRELPPKSAYKHEIKRHAAARNLHLQNMSCARPWPRRFALLRVPHLPRLVQAQGSHAKVHTARAAHKRPMNVLHFLC